MGFEIAQGLLLRRLRQLLRGGRLSVCQVYVFFGRAEAKQALADRGWTLEPITGDIYCLNCAQAAKNVKEAMEAKYPFDPSGVLPKDSKTEMHSPDPDASKKKVYQLPGMTIKKRFFKKAGEADMPVRSVAELFRDGDNLIEVLQDGTVTRYTKAHLVGMTRVMDPEIVRLLTTNRDV